MTSTSFTQSPTIAPPLGLLLAVGALVLFSLLSAITHITPTVGPDWSRTRLHASAAGRSATPGRPPAVLPPMADSRRDAQARRDRTGDAQ